MRPGIAFVLMVPLVFGSAMAAQGKLWMGVSGEKAVLSQLPDLLVASVITTGLVASIYKIMPLASVK